jgi:hypothetical protein
MKIKKIETNYIKKTNRDLEFKVSLEVNTFKENKIGSSLFRVGRLCVKY